MVVFHCLFQLLNNKLRVAAGRGCHSNSGILAAAVSAILGVVPVYSASPRFTCIDFTLSSQRCFFCACWLAGGSVGYRCNYLLPGHSQLHHKFLPNRRNPLRLLGGERLELRIQAGRHFRIHYQRPLRRTAVRHEDRPHPGRHAFSLLSRHHPPVCRRNE